MARPAGHKGPTKQLSYEQRKLKSKLRKERRQKQKEDINEVLDMLDREAHRLSTTHKLSLPYVFEQLHQGGRFARKKRQPNLFNAAQHAIGVVDGAKENLEICDEEREALKTVVEKVKALGGPEHARDLDEADRQVLTARLSSTRKILHTAPHARPLGVLHDTRNVLDSIAQEVHHMNARTSTEVLLFAVKGKDEHYQEGHITMTPKAEGFLVNILKLDPDKVSRDFEAYVLRNAEGVVLNHNDRLGEIRLKIRQLIKTALSLVAGVELDMEYVQFERRMVEQHGIDIVGWPTDILFANPSKISRMADLQKLHAVLSEGICHWVRLTPEQLAARKAENVRRLAAGEDPYAPRGGDSARTASKRRPGDSDSNTTASNSAARKKQKLADGAKKGSGKQKDKGKKKANTNTSAETTATEELER